MTVFRVDAAVPIIFAAVLSALTVAGWPIVDLSAQTQLGPPKKLMPGETNAYKDPAAPQPLADPSKILPSQQVPTAKPPQPVQPVLPVQPASTTMPAKLMRPVETEPAAAAAAPQRAPAANQTGIQVGALREIDPSSVGLLDPGAGGLGTEMWAGSDRGRIERLLPRLPMGTLSPVMQKMARRLLLSSAEVPKGEAVAPSLLGLRVERLAAGGLTDEVNRLLNLAPTRLSDPAFARAEMNGLLLTGDRPAFCTRIEDVVAADSDPYWLKGLAFCKALEGETQSVDLAVSILRDQGETGDEAFFTLADALSGNGEAVVDSLIDPSPLQLAMLRAARQPLPSDAVPGARPGILRAQAEAANADIDLRLAAAEKAEAAGALSTEALAQIYAGIEFSDDEMERWAELAGDSHTPRTNALLFQVATIESEPFKRAKVLQTAWRRARDEGGFGAMARVTYNAARSLEPSDEMIWAAADIGRALLMAGDSVTARRWFDLASEVAATPKQPKPPIKPVVITAEEAAKRLTTGMLGAPKPDAPPSPERPVDEAAQAVLELWPLILIADLNTPLAFRPAILEAWWPGQVATVGETAASERAAVYYSLLDAMGYFMPDTVWAPLLNGPLTVTAYTPAPALTRGLESAVKAKRIAETVLLCLLALGDVGPAGADPSTLHAVIRALRAVGLIRESRDVALEAAIGRGL